MASGNGNRTVVQLRQELRDLGLSSTGNKEILLERLRLNNSENEVPEQSAETHQPKRRRMNNRESNDNDTEYGNTESAEAESTINEQNTNMREMHLSEWERDLQKREEIIRLRETQALESRRDIVELLPQRESVAEVHQTQPFRLALRTIGLRDIIEILPEFDPDNRAAIDARQFIERVTLLKHTYNWEDGLVVLAVPAKLKGNAKIWADTQRNIHRRWEDFAADLIKNFPNHRRECDAHIELASIKRNSDESLSMYYYRMCAIARRAGINDAITVTYIRNGLNHNGLRNVIAGMNFDTCLELYAFLYRYEENNPNHSDNARSTILKSINRYSTPSTDSVDRKPNEPRNVRCYNCNDHGHLSINCPKPQRRTRCYKCQRSGHIARNCTETDQPRTLTNTNTTNAFSAGRSNMSKQESSSASNNNIRQIQEDHTLQLHSLTKPFVTKDRSKSNITKSILVGAHQITAFIDPGSDRSLVRESIAHSMYDVQRCDAILLKGFGGSTYPAGECIPVIIKIDQLEVETKLYLVNDDLLPEEVLLGKDTLCQSDIRFVIEAGSCYLERLPINENMTPMENHDFQAILAEFSDCFATSPAGLGRATVTEMSIDVTTKVPVSCRPYRIPFAKRTTVNVIIDELLELNIIRHSTSPYASPIVLVKKQNGEDRLCVDYRQLNAITIKLPYPMPLVEEQLAVLAGNTIFSSLDLVSGYHQIPIAESSKLYTAFVTNDGHYEFNRMPFGLVNAPSVFQTVINGIVQKLDRGEAVAYLDDIILPSKDVAEGILLLRKFLTVLKPTGLTLRLSKCKFLAEEVTFLGHRINKDGMIPGNEKTDAIRMFPTPSNLHELRQFLGLTGFFRKFVKNYADITRPLRPLLKTKNNPPFVWTIDHDHAFDTLKSHLVGEPILALYDQHKNHEVHTDASATGLAGVLMQEDDAGWRPVFYYSRHTNDAERNYHSYELEVLAIVESLERFKTYLLGKRFRVVTDCAAVATTKLHTPLLPRIARWWLKLQEFTFETVHRPAEQMQHADALSRNPVEPAREPPSVAEKIFRIEANEDDWLATMQHQDPKLKLIFQTFALNQNEASDKENRKLFKIVNNRLFRIEGSQLKWVVPSAVRWRILKSCHDDRGHFGLEKTLQMLQRDFWFRRTRDYTKKYLQACIECCYNKRHTGKTEGCLYVDPEQDPIPFRTLHMDHLGPFVKSKRGNSYVIAICDPFTKYVIVRAVPNTKTKPVVDMLNDLSSFFGLPQTVITDRGTAFTSAIFTKYCLDNNIKHIKNAVRTPRANGQVERVNGSILSFLRTTNEEPKVWDTHIRALQWTINSQKKTRPPALHPTN